MSWISIAITIISLVAGTAVIAHAVRSLYRDLHPERHGRELS